MRKIFAFIIPGLLIFFLLLNFNKKPQPSGESSRIIDILDDPMQVPYESGEPLLQKGDFQVFPLAKYSISAKVLAVKVNGKYSDIHTPGMSVYPIDIGFIWGEVAESAYNQYITYKHIPNSKYGSTVKGNYSLFVDWKKNLPEGWSRDYVMSHLSNNHIIPASEDVYNVICVLKRGQKVFMEGYLVSTAWEERGHTKYSSLSRTDKNTGNECEDFYVYRIEIGNKIYE